MSDYDPLPVERTLKICDLRNREWIGKFATLYFHNEGSIEDAISLHELAIEELKFSLESIKARNVVEERELSQLNLRRDDNA